MPAWLVLGPDEERSECAGRRSNAGIGTTIGIDHKENQNG